MVSYTVSHQLSSDLGLVIVPIAGAKALESALNLLESESGVSRDFISKDFSGEKGSHLVLYAGKRRLMLLGLGENPSFATTLRVFRQVAHKMKKRLSPNLGISFLYQNEVEGFEETLNAVISGLLLGTYQIGRYKTEEKETHPLLEDNASIHFVLEPEWHQNGEKAIAEGLATVETQLRIIDLVNAPSNKKTPQAIANWALESSERYGYKARVFDKPMIEDKGLHALLAVNRGSEFPPRFVMAEYGAEYEHTIGLVGKGVTFDSGGLSLKPSANMHYMKSDMGGAAAVLGTIELVAKLKLPIHLVVAVPLTDNSIGSMAIKPSDVIDSYSGKSIEIIDTDAEGRLILADGLSYVLKNYKPEILIDLATLTGSTVRTFGYQAAGLFTNHDVLAKQLNDIGEEIGERVWRLPIWEEYLDDMKSDVADIKNFSGRPIAGAITAAKFLEFFTESHPAWAHLDIAGVAFGDSEFSIQKSATGYGVRLLTQFIQKEIEVKSVTSSASMQG